MLSFAKGDLIKFVYITGAPNIAMGELQATGEDPLRDAEIACRPQTGCFSAGRVKFAVGQQPLYSAPGGVAAQPPIQHRDIYASKANIKLTSEDRKRIADNDQNFMKELSW